MNIDFGVIKALVFDYNMVLIKIYGIYYKFGNKLGKILIDKFAFPLLPLCGMIPKIYNLIFY
jgi:hypothetical protein